MHFGTKAMLCLGALCLIGAKVFYWAEYETELEALQARWGALCSAMRPTKRRTRAASEAASAGLGENDRCGGTFASSVVVVRTCPSSGVESGWAWGAGRPR